MTHYLRNENTDCLSSTASKRNRTSKKLYAFLIFLSVILISLFSETAMAQGTWTKLVNEAPDHNGGGMLLLSDGTVLAKSFSGSGSYGDIYDRLTPDIHGSYINGTWSTIAPMNESRLYYSSQVLMDGRVYVAGGEYGSGTSKSETYDPLTDVWTVCPSPGGSISDANSEILPDGNVLQAQVTGNLKKTKIYDPDSNKYYDSPNCLGIHNESTWIKLLDSSILQVDRGSVTSERYIPSLNKWLADADVPVDLYDIILETGAALLLPDGRVWHIGATGHTAYYTPSGDTLPGTWAAGPDVPDGNGQDDAPAAIMPNGKILFSAAPKGGFNNPTRFYEFDYLTDSYTSLSCPDGESSHNIPCYVTGMLLLPTGQVLVTFQDSTNYYVYTPDGIPIAEGKPEITGITQNGCTNSFTLTGTLFNGISEGTCYGDDWQMATNYPIVRFTTDTTVYYGRTYNWNSTGVMRGSQTDSAQLTISGLPPGIYSLYVIANGFESDPILFSPLSASIAANDTQFCEAGSVTLSANDGAEFSYQWLKDGLIIGGETSQSYIASESGSYSVVVSNIWGCDTISNAVSITINPLPQVLATTSDTSICEGESATLHAEGASTYVWQPGNLTDQDVLVNPTENTVYEVTGTDTNGCSKNAIVSISVNANPTIYLGNDTTVCDIANFVLDAGSGFTSYSWSTGATTQTIITDVSGTYVATVTNSEGCSSSDTIEVQVVKCTGINEVATSDGSIIVYPNPTSGNFILNVSLGKIPTTTLHLEIINSIGQKVFSEELSLATEPLQKEVSLSNPADGTYMIRVISDGQEFNSSLIISK